MAQNSNYHVILFRIPQIANNLKILLTKASELYLLITWWQFYPSLENKKLKLQCSFSIKQNEPQSSFQNIQRDPFCRIYSHLVRYFPVDMAFICIFKFNIFYLKFSCSSKVPNLKSHKFSPGINICQQVKKLKTGNPTYVSVRISSGSSSAG